MAEPGRGITCAGRHAAAQQGAGYSSMRKTEEEMFGENYIELESVFPWRKKYMFVDTIGDYKADQVFIDNRIRVNFGDEMVKPGSKYGFIFCRIRAKDEDRFLKSMKDLSNKHLLMGNKDYLSFCSAVFESVRDGMRVEIEVEDLKKCVKNAVSRAGEDLEDDVPFPTFVFGHDGEEHEIEVRYDTDKARKKTSVFRRLIGDVSYFPECVYLAFDGKRFGSPEALFSDSVFRDITGSIEISRDDAQEYADYMPSAERRDDLEGVV